MNEEPVIRVRNKINMRILQQKEISEENLYNIFIEEPLRTVYIVENDILIGIITLPDFKNNQLSDMMLVNRNFKKIDIENEGIADRFLKENRRFGSLPVVDAEGKVVKEYYIEDNTKERVTFPYIERVCYEAIWSGGGNTI